VLIRDFAWNYPHKKIQVYFLSAIVIAIWAASGALSAATLDKFIKFPKTISPILESQANFTGMTIGFICYTGFFSSVCMRHYWNFLVNEMVFFLIIYLATVKLCLTVYCLRRLCFFILSLWSKPLGFRDTDDTRSSVSSCFLGDFICFISYYMYRTSAIITMVLLGCDCIDVMALYERRSSLE